MQTQTMGKKIRKAISVSLALLVLIGFYTPVSADQYDDQIKALNQEIAGQNQQINALNAQEDNLRNQTQLLQTQINAARNRLLLAQAEYNQLTAKLDKAQAEMNIKKQALSANLRIIYQEGQATGLEMLASSKSLGDFIDKQQYLQTIKDSIQESVARIAKLKAQLDEDRRKQQIVISEQQAIQAGLNSQIGQLNTLIAQTQGQEATYRAISAANQEKVKQLKAQQAAALAARYGNIPQGGTPCGGGYPSKWCNAPQDSLVDSWGMYNRECVSYTAFRVANSGRRMPYWGGYGNANQWANNARAAGIPVSSTPKVGDVAVSYAGPYGHVMYVEAVNGNGTIFVSQYNFGMRGEYSTMTISASGLEFIHF